MIKNKFTYKYIFVILTYRNSTDLIDLLISIKKHINESYKCVIVNSFFDEESEQKIREICNKFDCDFLSVENKGYSYGNNQGIDYCNENYIYDFLIISNPDIVIKEFKFKFDPNVSAIYGPIIVNKNGKKQNPLIVSRSKILEKIIYYSFLKKSKSLLKIGTALNRLKRELFNFFPVKNKKKIFALHGSFLIASQKAVHDIGKFYDNNMFLFAEENVLALKASNANIPSYIIKSIKVFHKEDGSMAFISDRIYDELRRSNMYCYEKYQSKIE